VFVVDHQHGIAAIDKPIRLDKQLGYTPSQAAMKWCD